MILNWALPWQDTETWFVPKLPMQTSGMRFIQEPENCLQQGCFTNISKIRSNPILMQLPEAVVLITFSTPIKQMVSEPKWNSERNWILPRRCATLPFRPIYPTYTTGLKVRQPRSNV